ncbi:MAG: LysR family transcriptional regulator, partial [Cyanobacteriota bacterium]
MTPSTAMPPSSASQYRLPEMLQDIRLLDLLELCGSTVQTGQLMNLSQPTVSRRYRSLAADFGLARKRRTG